MLYLELLPDKLADSLITACRFWRHYNIERAKCELIAEREDEKIFTNDAFSSNESWRETIHLYSWIGAPF